MLRKKIISPSMVVMVLGMLVATLDARQIDDGVGPATPTSYCCAGITDLNQKANTTQIRRDVCNCLKPAASRFGVNPDRLKQLPTLCNITLNVPFDPSVDCNTVQ
ncbi:non-specific lipid-transfer protein [Medicago truncatula]|uniref:non-specific lipid-transfer protein n=1 Tax=Medicago truncatula TaxID=3880 RepID=UPI001966E6F7|nr:non-specific lipid-transfer protein-like [Medicago truncatula]